MILCSDWFMRKSADMRGTEHKKSYKWLKHNGALGIQTQGSRMGGEVVSTQLWELHKSEFFSGSNSLSASS